MQRLPKLKRGDKVAIVSPSFAAPGKWPHVYELGLSRMRDIFGLEPVEYPTTRQIGASGAERARDLAAAFADLQIRAVFASLGGNDQVTYIKNLSPEPFIDNPKPFFGYSDNTHLANFLWVHGIPSYYGGAILTQFAMQHRMDDLTIEYLKKALFEEGMCELNASATYNDINLNWNDTATLDQPRVHELNAGWLWDGAESGEGITWGGCLESIDEILRHGVVMPSLDDFNTIVLMTETSEEIPPAEYVFRVYRALGERGILARVRGVLVGRAKAWEIGNEHSSERKAAYRREQYDTIARVVRAYNPNVPIIQNMDFGHTDPQIALPYGRRAVIDVAARKVMVEF